MQNNFIDRCINGDALLDEIDDYIDDWHEEETLNETPLHTYLGMTSEEYALWVSDSDVLSSIVSARRKQISIHRELEQEKVALAARASSKEEFQKAVDWLEQLKSQQNI